MDNLRDSSISTGIGGPEGNHDNGAARIDIPDNGITGAIDPVTAADASFTPINDSGTTDDFAASFAEPASTGTGKRRGRKPGTRNKDAGEKSAVNINGIEKILYSIHAVLAGITKVPELELDEREAKDIANAIAGVSEQYMLTIDPKKAAWIDLARVVGVVYGPRGVSYYMRKKAEAAARPQPQTPGRQAPIDVGVVFQFDPKNQKPLGG